MPSNEQLDQFFAMLEDHDVDFAEHGTHNDVPVLTYRWCRNESISSCSVRELVDICEQSMRGQGLKRVVREGHHLRGDTDTGQRVKMTVVRSGQRTMYLLMTAGMPGTRSEAKEINAKLAKRIERGVDELPDRD